MTETMCWRGVATLPASKAKKPNEVRVLRPRFENLDGGNRTNIAVS